MSQRHIPELESILVRLRNLEAEARMQAKYCRTDVATDIPGMIEAATCEVGFAIAEEKLYIVQDELEYA